MTRPSSAPNYREKEPLKTWKNLGERETYDKGLIECKHDNQLDGQEFSKRSSALEFIFREAIEYQQAIQRNSTKIFRLG